MNDVLLVMSVLLLVGAAAWGPTLIISAGLLVLGGRWRRAARPPHAAGGTCQVGHGGGPAAGYWTAVVDREVRP